MSKHLPLYIGSILYLFSILYHILIYNDFTSVSQFPVMFSNIILIFASSFTLVLYSKNKLTDTRYKKLYYTSIVYNVLLLLFLNISIWAIPNTVFSFKTTERNILFKDPSYLSQLITTLIVSINIILGLKKEYKYLKESEHFMSIV
jgi:hypothetical protein